MAKCLLCLGLWLGTFIIAFTQDIAPKDPEAALAEAYLKDAEYDKALPLLEKYARRHPYDVAAASKVAMCYVQIKRYDEALQFLQHVSRRNTLDLLLPAWQGWVLQQAGKPEAAANLWQQLLTKQAKTAQDCAQLGLFFTTHREYSLAVQAYLQARKAVHQQAAFAAELADLYQAQQQPELAGTELLNQYTATGGSFNLLKSNFLRLVTPTSTSGLERALLASVQAQPQDSPLRELLVEFYLQAENFEEALLQAKALDRTQHESGARVFQLAQTFQVNHQYDLSNKALDYLAQYHKNSSFYLQVYSEKAKNFELKAFEARPLDTASLRQAVRNYDALLTQFGRQDDLVEAMYRKASLCMFYLNDLAAARQELQAIEALPIAPTHKAEARLLMGDVYLLEGEYGKAKLQYLQVEEGLKDAQLGAQAKYRGARLAYFKGDFELAKARLKALKDNASDDIANDAIQLFLLLQDNLGLDSSTAVLRDFSRAQLLVYQKRYSAALPILDSLMQAYPRHPIMDDVLWEKAQLYFALGKPQQAITYLDRLLQGYPESVLADDALFTKAEYFQFSVKNLTEAQQLYLNLLTSYPSSLFAVEARKRIRQLRSGA